MSVFNKDKAACCGCNACAEICPKHCIQMVEDAQGFIYPQVDSSVCVECGMCEKVCPLEVANLSLRKPLKAYAAWNKNRQEHLLSSSGGAAYIFSSYIIEKGGVVYGCTSDGIDVRHIRVENHSELFKLQGSKYVQSDVRGLFKKVKNDLKIGKTVLFIGTPCQVAGLKNYIGHHNEHLYLVDLICHGVPSKQMLHEHIKHVAKGEKIQHISFRKGTDYRFSITANKFSYEVSLWETPYKDLYLRGFIEGMINRPCCYQCPFACSTRVSDITIGDFWGLKNAELLPKESKDGISLLLPMTDKGLNLIHAVGDNMYICERSVDEAVNGNTQLRHPSLQGRRSRLFNILYPILSFDTAMNIVLADHKAIWTLKTIIIKHVRRNK
ncbi:Coenzyme F420 hydrogenase/dehydrogenase, beta subunit C-terminal domain [Phocaeicola plebeius]|uniref:Coenzyme F420 hydrogenase/dehydrogenase, beta subunit C-terminal domain n=1 Tax=Phocaeicola plebeius TaxID=310297 RepID=A0A921L4S3_9BACT|nr:Coenzyme F420 hydrogenase/dehydrogenase, beta subunit C-terminal domain [Phocaeicola plebeius]HJF80257.1 Coenzyme F420 hydrogenase/dehydrogenase, beta subunit C-terminal domain [Phocaeicola plebeius]